MSDEYISRNYILTGSIDPTDDDAAEVVFLVDDDGVLQITEE